MQTPLFGVNIAKNAPRITRDSLKHSAVGVEAQRAGREKDPPSDRDREMDCGKHRRCGTTFSFPRSPLFVILSGRKNYPVSRKSEALPGVAFSRYDSIVFITERIFR